MKPVKKISADNSPTLYLPELDEHYHSVYGAKSESEHVFIRAGLKQIHKPNIKILEIGFGTGLNALLSYLTARSDKIKLCYTGIEKYPLSPDIIEDLLTEDIPEKELFRQLHESPFDAKNTLSDFFSLTKIKTDLKDFKPSKIYDLIYFDAFAPDKQPELWTTEIFKRLFKACEKGGILVTYSAKGSVKQALRDAGFFVKRLPGPQGKRHMVQAIKQ